MFPLLSDLRKVTVYYTITFALCLVAALLAPRLGPSTPFLAMFTPLAGVLLMLLAVTRDGYTKAGWTSLGLNRAGWSGWPLAIALPAGILGFSYGTVWLTGIAAFRVPAEIRAGPFLLDLAVSLVVVTLSGGLAEEIGWRGYMLPRMMTLGTTPALLLSGLMHGCFHLPVLLWTPYYHRAGSPAVTVPLFLVTLTLAGVCYGYLRLATGSVWPVALAHGTFDVAWDRFNSFTATSSPLELEYLAGESGVLTVVALAAAALALARSGCILNGGWKTP